MSRRWIFAALILLAGGFLVGQAGCPAELTYEPLVPEEGVAQNITIEFYSDGWGNLLETQILRSEGTVLCDIPEENPYSDPPQYYAYAMADGYYTGIYYCTKGEKIAIDLDAIGHHEYALTGTFFAAQSFFSDHALADYTIDVTAENGGKTTIVTDDQGRFGMGGLDAGTYLFSLEYQGESFEFELDNSSGTDYYDTVFYEPMQAAKPVIYLYPEKLSAVDVTLEFPQGGHITESIPEYGEGWHVSVTPDGTIDGRYPYLFYEASLPPYLELEEGWVLDGSDLETQLRTLLEQLGFAGREVDDFVDYWVPRVEGWPYYAVYPQDADALVTLNISPEPDNILRASLILRGLVDPIELATPSVEPFVRDGFTALEWGVLVLE